MDLTERTGLLADLPSGVQDTVVRAGRFVHLDDGRPVFLQGDPSWSLGFVRGGHLKLVTTNEVARPFLSRMWGPGELFGHATAFDRLPRPGTATAVGRTELLVIDTDRFEQLQDEFPSLHATVQRALTTCLLESQSVAVDLATEGVGVRLARYLLRLAGASAAWSAVEADLEPAPECPCRDTAHCLVTAPVTRRPVGA